LVGDGVVVILAWATPITAIIVSMGMIIMIIMMDTVMMMDTATVGMGILEGNRAAAMMEIGPGLRPNKQLWYPRHERQEA